MIDECSFLYDSQDESIWSNVDIDLLSNMDVNHINAQKEIQSPKIPTSTSSPSSAVIFENKPHTMGGFTTASGKALKPISEGAKKIALALFNDEECMEEKPAIIEFATASGKSLGPVSKKTQKEALLLLENLDDKMKANSNISNGIKTSSGQTLEKLSRDSIELKSKSIANEGKVNPFKSPIIHSNIELTKAAINNKCNSKLIGQPVFNLTRRVQKQMLISVY
ncbi:hypothetical protein BD408DRAFT_391111 [Parasitella parasitica]|nr:hypothetical protein BD408DRAFT_391111 [Parasitella parasitica]